MGTRVAWESFGFRGGLYTPNSRHTSVAVYALEKVDLDPVRLEAGLRYDRVRVWPLREDPSSNIGHIRARAFGAVSGSLGALARLTRNVAVGASLARAFRTPSVSELYSEGPHLAAYAFEVGNPSLDTERGTGVDLFVRLTGDRLNAEATWFHNAMAGYVFPLETGELSRVRLPIFQFEGEDALLVGFEGALELAVVGDLTAEAVASHVRGDDPGHRRATSPDSSASEPVRHRLRASQLVRGGGSTGRGPPGKDGGFRECNRRICRLRPLRRNPRHDQRAAERDHGAAGEPEQYRVQKPPVTREGDHARSGKIHQCGISSRLLDKPPGLSGRCCAT